MPLHPRSTFRFGMAALGLGTVVLAGCSSGSGSHPSSSAAAPTHSSTAAASTPAATPAPVALRLETTALGKLLADPNGHTLYTFKLDKSGTSACTGTCATNWPPLTIGAGAQPTAPTGLVGKLATIMRAGGAEQVTFDGRPLYRFAGDTASGQTHGQDYKGLWFVVRIGAAPAAHATPRPVAPPMTHIVAPPMSHATTPHTMPPTTHAPAPPTPSGNCIPQNGGGDGDGDNSGGPSDGDGCV